MNQPPSPPKNLVVLKDTRRRDWIVALLIGAAILGGILFAILGTSGQKSANVLNGTIVEKVFTPNPELQVSYGKDGLDSKKIKGEYVFKVHVKSQDRTYDVPVLEGDFGLKKVGDPYTFLRPPSEQK